MKKLLIGLLILGFIIAGEPIFKKVQAAGGCEGTGPTMVANKNTAVADGKDKITITAHIGCYAGGTWYYYGMGDRSGYVVRLIISGEGNSVSPNEQANYGPLTFVITSSVSGSKAIHAESKSWHVGEYWTNWEDINGVPVVQITFNSPTTSPTTKTTTKPSSPILSTINNQSLPENKISTQIIRIGDPITFSGKTIANAKVKLYIYSDPITVEATSDNDGNWSYTLTQELTEGEHRIEAETVDAKGNTSDRIEIAKFTVKAKAVQPTELEKTSLFVFTPLTYGLAGLALVLIGVLVYLVIKRRKKML